MEPLGSAVLHTESGDMLTQEPIQDQDTLLPPREIQKTEIETHRQTLKYMHATQTLVGEKKKKRCSFILMSEDTMGQTTPQDGFWVKSLNKE